jgi:hypothetical protein
MPTPRVARGPGPGRKMTDNTYRKHALDPLVRDFGGRCAYSMIHMEDAGGMYAIDVEHFNPTLKGSMRNRYSNLMLSTRHCNLKKMVYWPNAAQIREGVRFLNPTLEMDYGEHIFEVIETGELVGVSDAARYHINILGLNDKFFIDRRLERTSIRRLHGRNFLFKDSALESLPNDVARINLKIEREIPVVVECEPKHVVVQPPFVRLLGWLAAIGFPSESIESIIEELRRRVELEDSLQAQ